MMLARRPFLCPTAVCFVGLAIAAWLGWRWLIKEEGNSNAVFSQLRTGMGQREAVEILQAFDASSCTYCHGVTADGRRVFDTSLARDR